MPISVTLNKNSPAAADAPDATQVSRIAGWLEDLFALTDLVEITTALFPVRAADGGTALNSSALTGVATVAAGVWAVGSGAIITSSVGPHAIGGTADSIAMLRFSGTWAPPGATEGRVIGIETTVTVPQDNTGEGVHIGPTLTKAGAGTHPTLMGLHVQPIFGAGAAAVGDVIGIQVNVLTAPASTTNASMIKLSAPTGATNNYPLWVDGGNSRFDGRIGIMGIATNDGLDLRGDFQNVNFSLGGTTASNVGVVYWRNSTPAVTGNIWATGDATANGILRIKGIGNIDLVPGSIGIDATAAALRIRSDGDIQWGPALVALGGGVAPTLGTIGGSGPAAAAQNTWMRVVDSAGAVFWVPAWK